MTPIRIVERELKDIFYRDKNDKSFCCHFLFFKYVRKDFLRPLIHEFRFSSDIKRIFLLEYRRLKALVAFDVDTLL